ncbi:MAG: hypothetical protein QOH04_29 [Sphingomonadales bacterium]|jgi:hypothetical protein|nr:hypothetical protein [Sphingomonadales bacterium]
MPIARLTMLTATILLGACATDLRTTSLGRSTETELPAGFAYNLPAAVVSPSASIRIADCIVDTDAKAMLNGAEGPNDPITGAAIAVSGDISVEQVAGQPVLIDYRELGDFLKTSSVGIERHPNLMLKSVNVSVEDQSPQLIANVAVVAADIALFAVNPAAGAAGAAGIANHSLKQKGMLHTRAAKEVSYLACSAETAKLVASRKAARLRRDEATQKLEEATAALETLMRNADTGFTRHEIEQIHALRQKVLDHTGTIADATDEMGTIDGKLSLALHVKPGTPTDIDQIKDRGLVLEAAPGQIEAFVAKHFITAKAKVTADVETRFNQRDCLGKPDSTCEGAHKVGPVLARLASATLTAEPQPVPHDGHTPNFLAASAPKKQKDRSGFIHPSQGIVYVEPARYTFSLRPTAPAADPLHPVVTLKSVNASIPQLGTYIGLPLHAGFGEKVELKATFNTDGSLATASYGKPSSAGVAISATLAALADKALATRDAIAERKLKMLKDEADRLTAQQSIVDANAKLNPKADPLADLHSQIAVAEANAALAEANLRVRLANAQGNGGN